jgi:hypothetical protein
LHAGKTQAFALSGGLDVESPARVVNCELNFAGALRDPYFNSLHVAVLDCVMKGLLQNAKEAEPDIGWETSMHVTSEVDLHPLPLREFIAPASYARNDTQIFQF